MTATTPFPDNAQDMASPDVTSELFREAMSRVGAAVNIITSGGPGGVAGFTATSFTSVSDAPPLVLICVNLGGRSNEIIRRNGSFCVNTLADGQAELATRFAQKGTEEDDRFKGLATIDTPSGAPRLKDALISLDCRLEEWTDIGTHSVFFGAVQDAVLGANDKGLMYRSRAYHKL